MRVLLALAVLAPSVASADLYRWVDPETGSVRFSNYPPPSGTSASTVPFKPVPVVPEKADKPAAGPATPPKPQAEKAK